MKDTHNLSKFRSCTRVRQIVGGIIVLLALALAGSPRAWGQCSQGIASVTFNPGSIIAPAPNPHGTAIGTVTLYCNSWFEPTTIAISVSPNNGVLTCSQAGAGEGLFWSPDGAHDFCDHREGRPILLDKH